MIILLNGQTIPNPYSRRTYTPLQSATLLGIMNQPKVKPAYKN